MSKRRYSIKAAGALSLVATSGCISKGVDTGAGGGGQGGSGALPATEAILGEWSGNYFTYVGKGRGTTLPYTYRDGSCVYTSNFYLNIEEDLTGFWLYGYKMECPNYYELDREGYSLTAEVAGERQFYITIDRKIRLACDVDDDGENLYCESRGPKKDGIIVSFDRGS
jgi:hypothetical protein